MKVKPDPVIDRFSIRLRGERQARNLTQAELAKRAGISALHISHFECGRRLPSLENYARLVKALNVHSGWLIGFPK